MAILPHIHCLGTSQMESSKAQPSPTGRPAVEAIEVKAGVFKDTCLQLLDRVREEGIEVLVTKRGVPVARLVPPGPRVVSPYGALRGSILADVDLDEPDHEAWGDLA